jgi:hypothetical protein
MKFDDRFPDAQPGDQPVPDIVKTAKSFPCWNCKEETSWVEINFGVSLCSEECVQQKDRELNEGMKEG